MGHKQFEEISFYIVAHADDWQLFMNPNAYLDLINEETKVVIIITTAGDAGKGQEYWAAREEGCKSSVRFCLAPHYLIKEHEGTKNINNHEIHFWEANNVVVYFLRLPDGNLNGNGFSNNYYLSLSRLRSREILSITSVDHSTLYHDWDDFYFTLNGIIVNESEGISNPRINYLDPDLNSYDHPDHRATGYAIQAMEILSQAQQMLFSGYECVSPEVISSGDFFWKVGMLAAYEKAVFDNSGYSTLKEDVSLYLDWCLRKATVTQINHQLKSTI